MASNSFPEIYKKFISEAMVGRNVTTNTKDIDKVFGHGRKEGRKKKRGRFLIQVGVYKVKVVLYIIYKVGFLIFNRYVDITNSIYIVGE